VNTPTNVTNKITNCNILKHATTQKHKKYDELAKNEDATFFALAMLSYGSMSKEFSNFIRFMASAFIDMTPPGTVSMTKKELIQQITTEITVSLMKGNAMIRTQGILRSMAKQHLDKKQGSHKTSNKNKHNSSSSNKNQDNNNSINQNQNANSNSDRVEGKGIGEGKELAENEQTDSDTALHTSVMQSSEEPDDISNMSQSSYDSEATIPQGRGMALPQTTFWKQAEEQSEAVQNDDPIEFSQTLPTPPPTPTTDTDTDTDLPTPDHAYTLTNTTQNIHITPLPSISLSDLQSLSQTSTIHPKTNANTRPLLVGSAGAAAAKAIQQIAEAVTKLGKGNLPLNKEVTPPRVSPLPPLPLPGSWEPLNGSQDTARCVN
jgi:hypothetical protein